MAEIDWKHLLFKFDGRVNRGKFWLGAVVNWIAGLLLVGMSTGIAFGIEVLLGVIIFVLGIVVILWVNTALAVKRWHDRDKSGWWVLIGLIPILGGIWAFVETGLLEGTQGDNQYGPNPLAEDRSSQS